MCLTDNESEDVDRSVVLHSVLRQHHKSRRNTYTVRVPFALKEKFMLIGNEQSTIAYGNVDQPALDTMA